MDQATIDARRKRLVELSRKHAEERAQKEREFLAPFESRLPSTEILNKIQYRHNNLYGYTLAVVPPLKENLTTEALRFMAEGRPTSITFQLGVAWLNPADGDQYNRRYGRIISASKLETVSGELVSVSSNGEKTYYNVRTNTGFSFSFMLSNGRYTPFVDLAWENKVGLPYDSRVALYKKK